MANTLISCDDHMDLQQLPADLWTTRLPAEFRDRAPHIEERDGQAMWICDGKVWGRWAGKPPATRPSARSRRFTTRSTVRGFTTTARAARRFPNCASPIWTATACRPP